ncbi:MAG: hypothetical protein FJX62_11235 [Alphaproteobacteria bacterium]|nr:hypothetical protein [Alphaproteobacteria bacterium]
MRHLITAFCWCAVAAGAAVPVAFAVQGQQFVSTPRLMLLGAAPAAIAALALLALWRGQAARSLFAIYAAALGVALLGVELYLRVPEATPAGRGGSHDAAAALRAEGVRAYPHFCGSMVEAAKPIIVDGRPAQPVAGMSRNLLTPELPDRGRWRFTDRHGFNNPDGQWDLPGPAVMAVGDSFTFGADVPIGRGFVDRLRERAGKTLNLGCGGNGPLLELAGLAEFGPPVRPARVLWVFYEGNDLTKDLDDELTSAILPQYLKPGFTQNLATRQPALDLAIEALLKTYLGAPVPAPAPGAAVALNRSVLTLEFLRTSLGLRHRVRADMLGQFEAVLRRAKDIVASWNGSLILVYLPAQTRYTTALGQWDAEAYARQVKSVADRLHIPVIDVAAAVGRHADPNSLYQGHFNEAGYALVAETILASASMKP